MADASTAAATLPADPAALANFDPGDIAQVTRPPLVTSGRNMAWITNRVCGIVEGKTPTWWWIGFLITAPIAAMTFVLLGYLIFTGIGVWGENVPVAWAWDITNFVFWIGIGHAGPQISAILFLPATLAHFHQPRRRGDDPLCGHLRRLVSGFAHRPAVDGVDARARAEPIRDLAEF